MSIDGYRSVMMIAYEMVNALCPKLPDAERELLRRYANEIAASNSHYVEFYRKRLARLRRMVNREREIRRDYEDETTGRIRALDHYVDKLRLAALETKRIERGGVQIVDVCDLFSKCAERISRYISPEYGLVARENGRRERMGLSVEGGLK